MLMNLIGSVCLSDIPKEFIRTGRDGKQYLPVYIGQRRQTSQYGHTHFIKVYVPKERREEGVEYFIGEAKPSEYQTQQSRIMAGAEAYVREQQQQRPQYQQPPRQGQQSGQQYGRPRQAQQPQPQSPVRQSFDVEDETGDLPF